MHCPAWILPHEICSVSEYTPHADEPMDAELRRRCSQPHRVCGVNWISLCSWDICSRHGYQNWRSKTLSLILRHSHFTWCKTLTITSSWPTFWCHGTVLSPDFASRQIKQQNLCGWCVSTASDVKPGSQETNQMQQQWEDESKETAEQRPWIQSIREESVFEDITLRFPAW